MAGKAPGKAPGKAVWVFGYGSLVWRPGFPAKRREVGYVKGFVRRFHQGSTDHCGTPARPGRTVTLEPASEADVVFGAAYEVDAAGQGLGMTEDEVLEYLDEREKQYDDRRVLPVFRRAAGGAEVVVVEEALCYIGTPACENYLGPAPDEELARTIVEAEGPSGPNKEYLFGLADAMRAMGVGPREDPHLFRLERLAKDLLGSPP